MNLRSDGAIKEAKAYPFCFNRWTWEAVHTGTSPSLGIPPTGKHVGFVGCSVYHFRDGKIVEQWEYGDVLGLLQQLGMIPALG